MKAPKYLWESLHIAEQKTNWKAKWEHWLELTKQCLNKYNIHLAENEEYYWQIIRHFGDFFSRELGYDGPDPQPIFAEVYGELFAKYLINSPRFSWMKKRDVDAKKFIHIMKRTEVLK